VVDDWGLVSTDDRRILGRLHREGRIGAPGARQTPRVHGELGAVVAGALRGRESEDETIVFNPFGMAIEDVALASEVYATATRSGVGLALPR
jgi:N-[(2S)-2-amino-2-carboxyethyl]-L-glutamate dehydrogenase